jgi:hypothetical protein
MKNSGRAGLLAATEMIVVGQCDRERADGARRQAGIGERLLRVFDARLARSDHRHADSLADRPHRACVLSRIQLIGRHRENPIRLIGDDALEILGGGGRQLQMCQQRVAPVQHHAHATAFGNVSASGEISDEIHDERPDPFRRGVNLSSAKIQHFDVVYTFSEVRDRYVIVTDGDADRIGEIRLGQSCKEMSNVHRDCPQSPP